MNMHAVSRTRGRAGRYAATALGAMVVLAWGAFAPAAAQAAAPTTLYVSHGGHDKGTCTSASPCATVSYALTKAASLATIEVSGTIDDHLTISHPVTITAWPSGPAGSSAVLDGTANGAVVTVNSGVGDVTLNDLTIKNGTRGILNEGTLTLTDSTVSGNANGGFEYAGIWNDGGTLAVIDSTVTKNSGDSDAGGGIGNYSTMTVIASTISGNTGGGIYSDGNATLGATIVADNTKGSNCDATATSLQSVGYNLTNDKTGTACKFTAATDLVNKNPLLGHLANNGGPTQTLLPGATSPAANVIPNPTTLQGVGVEVCPSTDQRGDTRPGPGETHCTIGAVEAGYTNPTTTSVTVSPATVTEGTQVVYLAVVTPKSGTGTATGKISFNTGSTSLCTAVLSGGAAACGATNAPAGTDTVTGTYSGGGGYASSSGTATLTVTP
jgi:Bacterial Ig-like domain (group 3)